MKMKKYNIGLRECMVLLMLLMTVAVICIFSAKTSIDHSFDVPRPYPVFNLDMDSSYYYMISSGKRRWDSSIVCTSGIIDTIIMDSLIRENEQ